MAQPTYHEIEKYLDKYWEHTEISGVSVDAQGFLMEVYLGLKKLMADMQKIQERLDDGGICQCKPSVN